MPDPTLRNQLRRLRADRGGMPQQQLADAVGVTRQTIISVEAGRYAPSLLLAFRIAAALDVQITKAFQYE